MRTNIVTGTQPCHVEPSLRIVHQGRSHGFEHHSKVQEEIRYNFALQTHGNKNSRRTVKQKFFFVKLKEGSIFSMVPLDFCNKIHMMSSKLLQLKYI